nr:unnamed protein product [Callosobruchus chinensis]
MKVSDAIEIIRYKVATGFHLFGPLTKNLVHVYLKLADSSDKPSVNSTELGSPSLENTEIMILSTSKATSGPQDGPPVSCTGLPPNSPPQVEQNTNNESRVPVSHVTSTEVIKASRSLPSFLFSTVI